MSNVLPLTAAQKRAVKSVKAVFETIITKGTRAGRQDLLELNTHLHWGLHEPLDIMRFAQSVLGQVSRTDVHWLVDNNTLANAGWKRCVAVTLPH